MTTSQGIFHYTQENILYAALYGSRTNYEQVILNYHPGAYDWASQGIRSVTICGTWFGVGPNSPSFSGLYLHLHHELNDTGGAQYASRLSKN